MPEISLEHSKQKKSDARKNRIPWRKDYYFEGKQFLPISEKRSQRGLTGLGIRWCNEKEVSGPHEKGDAGVAKKVSVY